MKHNLTLRRKKCRQINKIMSRKDKIHRCILKKPLKCIPTKTYNKKTKKCRIKCIRGKEVRKGTRNRCIKKTFRKKKNYNNDSNFGLKYEDIYIDNNSIIKGDNSYVKKTTF
jgi:hypothetical protein